MIRKLVAVGIAVAAGSLPLCNSRTMGASSR